MFLNNCAADPECLARKSFEVAVAIFLVALAAEAGREGKELSIDERLYNQALCVPS